MLDNLDRKILNILQDDASVPIGDIAEQVGSSKSVCWRRLQRMTEKGIIKDRVMIVDAEKVGLELMVFAQVKMSAHGRTILPEFVKTISAYPQVIECHTLMGTVDFLLKVVVRNIHEYEYFFWHELSQIEGVQEVSSSIAMTQVKSTTKLPLFDKPFVAPATANLNIPGN